MDVLSQRKETASADHEVRKETQIDIECGEYCEGDYKRQEQ